MRTAIIGAGEAGVLTATALIAEGHEVIVIDDDRSVIDALEGRLDCSFLHGDGAKPAVLSEVDPEQTDILFCLTGDDRVNVIASLVGRSLGFKRVVTSIQDPQLEGICDELGLDDTIIPARAISRHLVDMTHGLGEVELSTVLRGDARFFTFTVGDDAPATIGDLDLTRDTRAVCHYRGETFRFADPEVELRRGDTLVLLTHSRRLPELTERWRPRTSENDGGS
jgi:trk system potassium uptake protein TrkA